MTYPTNYQHARNADSARPELSIFVVSFNTRDLLRRSLVAIQAAASDVRHELIVVDNASHDGSAEMVESEFPSATLIRAPFNLGFAAANNLARQAADGEFIALINPDAFPDLGSLRAGVDRMRAQPRVALAGGLLIGKNGQPEPSARMFPSPLNDFLALSGLSASHAKSRFFGRFDRTWADPDAAAMVDWVPGAYCLVRSQVIDQIGFFDERFFLYYEEVDLCRRMHQAGFQVAYWPDLRAVHWGGESSKTVSGQKISSSGRQLTLWRMRSALLYYRKHHGWLTTALSAAIEIGWHMLRRLRNRHHPEKAGESSGVIAHMRRAWQDTLGGKVSPPRPW